MACHGELAKDRPSTTHLTDFYLMMSIGGVCGGILNAIIAPLFPWVFEFNLALIAACLLRPTIPFGNFLDDVIAKMADSTPEPTRGPKARGKAAPVALRTANEPTEQLSYAIDVGVGVAIGVLAFATIFIFGGLSTRESSWPLIVAYGVPLLLALTFMFRPLRFGLAIAGILIAQRGVHPEQRREHRRVPNPQLLRRHHGPQGSRVHRRRQAAPRVQNPHARHHRPRPMLQGPRRSAIRPTTTAGWRRPTTRGSVRSASSWKSTTGSTPTRRRPTSSRATRRMPASLVASAAFGSFGMSPLPLAELVEAWSEPPYATIGLGTGTMASYSRPFQHCHFYEIDEQIRKLSLPKNGQPHFTYLQQALDRGAAVQVLMGDARQRMHLPYENYYEAAKADEDKKPSPSRTAGRRTSTT